MDGRPHLKLDAELCGRCPQGVTGCCAAPPVVAWADLGRIVLLGGRDWLLAELAAGRLYPCARGLALQRVENPDAAATGRAKKCVHHGERGCTIPPDRRSATCNYYVCDEAWSEAGDTRELRRARASQERLTEDYARWDLLLGERVRARHPDGPPWDEAFLDWLGAELSSLWAL
ncbi:MAG: hypothetical protein HYV09_01790 [Deltaproteobacteria bacterium]|nr:hypothetical protein [Deltaproteobacteria bacterium]